MKETYRAFTLVELLISVMIISIGLGSILVAKNHAVIQTRKSLIKYTVLLHARSLLNTVQSYPYNDSAYSTTALIDMNEASYPNLFDEHDQTFGSYDTTTSGVYNSSNILINPLDEEHLTLQYHPTTLPASPTPDYVFDRNPSLQNNDRLIGPENDDKHADSATAAGFYKIEEKQIKRNLFQGDELAKYYFMDDVDDFDGYQEIREIMPGVTVTFDISVMLIWNSQQDYTWNLTGTDYTLNQLPYSVMPPLSLLSPPAIDNDPTGENLQKFLVALYRNSLFKKISVQASWEHPQGSGNIQTLVLNGGKINDLNIGA